MEIKTLDLEGTNCYLISSEQTAIVIDPAIKCDETELFLKSNSNKKRLICSQICARGRTARDVRQYAQKRE